MTTATCEQVVPEGLANTLANAMSEDDRGAGTAAGAAGSVGWDLPMSGKTGTTEANRSSGFLGFTNQLAAANYIYDDSNAPSELCSYPLRQCGSGNLYGGNEPAATWFATMKPIATNFGEVVMPPTDPRYVDGGPNSRVPSVAASRRTAPASDSPRPGLQVAEQASSVNSSSSYGTVVGTSPSGQTIPGSIVTILVSNGVAPAPPPRPAARRVCRRHRRWARPWWRFRACRRSRCRCWCRLRLRNPAPGSILPTCPPFSPF